MFSIGGVEVLDAVSIGILAITSDYEVVFWNRCMEGWTGIAKEEIVGKDIRQKIPNLKLPVYESRLESLFQLGTPVVFSSQLHRQVFEAFLPNGDMRIQHTQVSAIADKSQKDYMALFCVEDVTEISRQAGELQESNKTARRELEERKKVEKALEDKSVELEKFAYSASHDLKAPLRSITNLVSFIEEDLSGKLDDDTKKYMDRVYLQISRMNGLIRSLLEYAMADKHSKEMIEVDTGLLVDNIVDMLRETKGIDICVSPSMPTFVTTKTPLEQVFRNLVSNAFKYHDKTNGKVDIVVSEKDEHFLFEVIDNGPGIEKESQKKIFDIFAKLETKDKIEGSGIGLALVKKLVENNGGEIGVHSEKGEGSRFYFTWPKTLQTELTDSGLLRKGDPKLLNG
ncbi:MAG: PAS domain S-box protein [Deltaproteobacteria bacterium]|nr:PAS domain S-box protein [Deltaproteobacteria bacterium]